MRNNQGEKEKQSAQKQGLIMIAHLGQQSVRQSLPVDIVMRLLLARVVRMAIEIFEMDSYRGLLAIETIVDVDIAHQCQNQHKGGKMQEGFAINGLQKGGPGNINSTRETYTLRDTRLSGVESQLAAQLGAGPSTGLSASVRNAHSCMRFAGAMVGGAGRTVIRVPSGCCQ